MCMGGGRYMHVSVYIPGGQKKAPSEPDMQAFKSPLMQVLRFELKFLQLKCMFLNIDSSFRPQYILLHYD